MKIKELIEKLQQFNPEMDIWFSIDSHNQGGEYQSDQISFDRINLSAEKEVCMSFKE